MAELKPCPFEHEDDVELQVHSYEDGAGNAFSYVACEVCESRGPVTDTPEQAIAAWNRRAND